MKRSLPALVMTGLGAGILHFNEGSGFTRHTQWADRNAIPGPSQIFWLVGLVLALAGAFWLGSLRAKRAAASD